MSFHLKKHSGTTLALKKMHQFDRYGVVNADASGIITSFDEKQYREDGMINGGAYIINSRHFFSKHFHHKFSFEQEYLERFAAEHKFYGFVSDAYFIDIGIPADYTRAQEDFKTMFK